MSLVYEVYKREKLNLLSRIKANRGAADRARTQEMRESFLQTAWEAEQNMNALDAQHPLHRQIFERGAARHRENEQMRAEYLREQREAA